MVEDKNVRKLSHLCTLRLINVFVYVCVCVSVSLCVFLSVCGSVQVYVKKRRVMLNGHNVFLCAVRADNMGSNPGLAALWEDERQRRRDAGQASQITPQDSQGTTALLCVCVCVCSIASSLPAAILPICFVYNPDHVHILDC